MENGSEVHVVSSVRCKVLLLLQQHFTSYIAGILKRKLQFASVLFKQGRFHFVMSAKKKQDSLSALKLISATWSERVQLSRVESPVTLWNCGKFLSPF